jgi:hypothetical protein
MSDHREGCFHQESFFTPRGDEKRSFEQLSEEERRERFPLLELVAKISTPTVEMSQVQRWRDDLNDALFEMEGGTTREWEDGARMLEEVLHSMDAKLQT